VRHAPCAWPRAARRPWGDGDDAQLIADALAGLRVVEQIQADAVASGYGAERGRSLESKNWLLSIKGDPIYAGLHDDPRWTAVLRRMHLAD
jgi:hypothetical protein